jgi:hypothetical protein
LELKFESKDILFVTFQQNNPPAIKPCMSRELVIFQSPDGYVMLSISILSLAVVDVFQVMMYVMMAFRGLVLYHPVWSTSGRMTVLSGITNGLV